MKQLEETQLWNKTQHQLRADEFQIPLLHKYFYVGGNFRKTHIDKKMRLNDKYHWDGFIYGLVYPGFVGSMIYELIPATKLDATLDNFLTYSTAIKIIITTFYCLDYLHLYGDMHPKAKPEKRSWTYLFCDVGSSLFFFFSFVMAKLQHYEIALILVAFIPMFFAIYKDKNKKDKSFIRYI